MNPLATFTKNLNKLFRPLLSLCKIRRTSMSKISTKVIKLMPKNIPMKPPIEANNETLFNLADSVIIVYDNES